MSTRFRAFKEASADTFIGTVINMPLSYIMLYIAYVYEWLPSVTTVVMTVFFAIMAIIRKMVIRLYFAKRYQKNSSANEDLPK